MFQFQKQNGHNFESVKSRRLFASAFRQVMNPSSNSITVLLDTTYDGRDGIRSPAVSKNRVPAGKAQGVILLRRMWPCNAIDNAFVSRTCNEWAFIYMQPTIQNILSRNCGGLRIYVSHIFGNLLIILQIGHNLPDFIIIIEEKNHVFLYYVNPLKTKRKPLYLKTQSVPRCKHFSSRL